ncbi:MAG: protein translocase subunit SecF [Spirochaetales bacterium]|nr:protein translocase subunit SecF [Spirochaetales bacterium]
MQIKKAIPFSKLRWPMYIFSIVLIVAVWVGTLLQGGFNLGIDFKPGLSETVKINNPEVTVSTLREALKLSDYIFSIQPVGTKGDQTFLLRAVAHNDQSQVANLQAVLATAAKNAIEKRFGTGSVDVLSSDFIGPSLSNEIVLQTFWLTLAAVIVILLYIWFRFKFAYAVAAIIALIHDPIFIVGLIGTLQMEVSTATIAVVLTIIGYSLNDTIVVFDRIRENIRLQKTSNMFDLIDLSITQTLSRTLVSSLTVLISAASLWFFTTGQIHDFAFALIVGVVIGTYSSIFIAAPLMVSISGGKPPVEKEKKALPPEEGLEA